MRYLEEDSLFQKILWWGMIYAAFLSIEAALVLNRYLI